MEDTPSTEVRGRDTMEQTRKEAPYYARREEEKRTARPETAGDFIQEDRQEAFSTRQIGDSLHGFRRPVQRLHSTPAGSFQEELTALGIPGILTGGAVERNQDGITTTRSISEAATIEKKLIAISDQSARAFRPRPADRKTGSPFGLPVFL